LSYQDQIVQLATDMPDSFAAVVFYLIKNYLDAAEKADDDAFCNSLYERYLANPDKGEGVPIEVIAARLGVVLE